VSPPSKQALAIGLERVFSQQCQQGRCDIRIFKETLTLDDLRENAHYHGFHCDPIEGL
jgi:hypothetical protein